MTSADWQIHPRNGDRERVLDPVSGFTNLTLVERHNVPDSWTVTGPPSALAGFAAGDGCIVDRDGQQITSGQVNSIKRGTVWTGTRREEQIVVTFASDLGALANRVVFPTPSHAPSAAISTFPDAYDLRTGPIEDAILGYIGANIGPAAPLPLRRHHRLRLPTSLGRGGNTQTSARLDVLGVLVQSLAEAGDLRVKINHAEDADGPWLDLVIDATADLSDDIRFGTADSTATGLISEWSYELSAPTATRVLVGLGGELTAREFIYLEDPGAEFMWRTVVEQFVDQRNIAPDSEDKLVEATREGTEALAAGAGPVKVEFTPALGPDLEYRRDVRVGDTVGYDLPGLEPAKDKIREATTVVSVENGKPSERVSVVVGSVDSTLVRSQLQVWRALRAINMIQRSK